MPREAVIRPVEPLGKEADDLLRDRGELVDAYADELREQGRISDVEAAYGDLIRLLKRELRGGS